MDQGSLVGELKMYALILIPGHKDKYSPQADWPLPLEASSVHQGAR